jgi:hypothetical protein
MAKKNSDSKSFNRTGLFDKEKMTLLYEDKDGKLLFDLGAKLTDLDGEFLSISVNADLEPDYVKVPEE